MSDILKSNLSFIEKHNPSLCSKLTAISEYKTNIEIKPNLAGEYNLAINGMGVHSLTGALQEAKDICATLPNNSNNSIHVVYGIGLGYIVDELVNNAKGNVIVYEQDLDVLHFVLSAVDFAQNFNTQKLYIVSDITEFEQILYKVFKYKSKATLSCLDYYKAQDKLRYEAFQAWLKRKVELVDHNFKLQALKMYGFFKNTLIGLDKKYKLPFLTENKDALKGKPAIIVSAGPSLNKNIEILKKYKDNAVIFCVGTALRTLYNNNITPDFLNVIETENTSLHYNLPCSKDISFIAEPFTQAAYLDIPFKKRFITASLETDASRWFLETAGKEFIPFEAKGTVAYHAIYSAYYLGCNPIILIGQDLAYSDGQCYAKGSKFDGLECVYDNSEQKYKIKPRNFEEYRDSYYATEGYSIEKKNKMIDIKLKELNKNITFVKGQDNNVLPTDNVYAIFLDYIQDFAANYGHERTLINSSLGGALISGFDLLSLEDACEKYAPTSIDKQNISGLLNDESTCDIEIVLKNLKQDYKKLAETKPLFEEGYEISTKLKELVDNGRDYSPKSDSPLNKLGALYSIITNRYMLKSRVVKILHAYSYCNLSYLIRENNIIDNTEQFHVFSNAYYDYFYRGLCKTNQAIRLLQEVIDNLEKINESSVAKG